MSIFSPVFSGCWCSNSSVILRLRCAIFTPLPITDASEKNYFSIFVRRECPLWDTAFSYNTLFLSLFLFSNFHVTLSHLLAISCLAYRNPLYPFIPLISHCPSDLNVPVNSMFHPIASQWFKSFTSSDSFLLCFSFSYCTLLLSTCVKTVNQTIKHFTLDATYSLVHLLNNFSFNKKEATYSGGPFTPFHLNFMVHHFCNHLAKLSSFA